MTWNKLVLSLLVVGIIAGVAGTIVVQAANCPATITSSLRAEDKLAAHTTYIWKVDIESRESCLNVYYALVVDIEEPSGETVTKKKHYRLNISSSFHTQMVKYRIASDRRLVRHEFKIRKCKDCDELRLD